MKTQKRIFFNLIWFMFIIVSLSSCESRVEKIIRLTTEKTKDTRGIEFAIKELRAIASNLEEDHKKGLKIQDDVDREYTKRINPKPKNQKGTSRNIKVTVKEVVPTRVVGYY
ncbi:MAG: hypothetical protein QM535_20980 [Limnohabitans sp.]|nr:hypothetical protein [Limnohabitans sp.]